MSRCYFCDHGIVAICDRCGTELTIFKTRSTEGLHGQVTQIRIVPCDCPPYNDDFGKTFSKAESTADARVAEAVRQTWEKAMAAIQIHSRKQRRRWPTAHYSEGRRRQLIYLRGLDDARAALESAKEKVSSD